MTDLAFSAETRTAGPATASELDLNQAGRFLDQAVVANARDLHAHIQRIHFHWQRRQTSAVFAALVDMFCTLGPAGIEIRTRMLRNCEELLSNEQRVFLLQHLDKGLTDSATLPAGTKALLFKRGNEDAGDPLQPNPTNLADSAQVDERESVSLLLAQEYQRHGWDDLAKGLLQELVAAEPDNALARRALLQLP